MIHHLISNPLLSWRNTLIKLDELKTWFRFQSKQENGCSLTNLRPSWKLLFKAGTITNAHRVQKLPNLSSAVQTASVTLEPATQKTASGWLFLKPCQVREQGIKTERCPRLSQRPDSTDSRTAAAGYMFGSKTNPFQGYTWNHCLVFLGGGQIAESLKPVWKVQGHWDSMAISTLAHIFHFDHLKRQLSLHVAIYHLGHQLNWVVQ